MTTRAGSAPAFEQDRTVTVLDVPVDEPNDRALPFAAWLAEVWNLPIRLLHVSSSISSSDADLDAALAEFRRVWPALPVETEHLYGDDPAIAIAAAVGAHSLPVLSSDQASAWSFKLSVAEALVEQVGVPVILIGPAAREPDRLGNVVVAYDGRPAGEAALTAAVDLAVALGRKLWLVQVVAESTSPGSPVDTEVGSRLHRRVETLDPITGPRWEVIQSNDPVTSIEAFADRVGASFLVAAARGRTDMTRTTMSSITMGLVAAAARPVLVVHPGRPDDQGQ